MAQRTPFDNSAVQSGTRPVRISTILFILALGLLLIAAVAFAVELVPNVVTTAAAPELGPAGGATPIPVAGASPTAGQTAAPPTPTATPSSAALVNPPVLPPTPLTTPTRAPATPTPQPTAWTLYMVRPGDTLSSIAADASMPITDLAEVNQLSIDQIRPGTILLVPKTTLTPEAATLTPTSTETSTPIASPTPTATFTPTPTPTAPPTPTATATLAPTPLPIGRFAMGFPLTMTVGGDQIVYVEITTAAAGTPDVSAGGNDTGTGVAGKIRVAVGEPDVLTEVVRDIRLFPNMGAVLDAPEFTVHTSGPAAADIPDWRSLRDGSALWLWNIAATRAGKQTLTVQVFGRQSPGDAPEDVLFEVRPVAVLVEPLYASVMKSEVLRSTASPIALVLSALMISGGLFMRRKERLTRPVKGLPGIQVKQLQGALLSAFTTKESLEQMVRIQLDQNLAVISTGENLSDIVYDLIRWAEANGQIERLLQGALAENPGNADLQQVVAQWKRGTTG